MYTVKVLDPSGHTTRTVEPSPGEVDRSLKKLFGDLTEEGYAIFSDEPGKTPQQMKRPDSRVHEMLAVPPLVGG